MTRPIQLKRRTVCGGLCGGAALAASGLLQSGCGNPVNAAPLINATVDDDPSSPRYGQVGVIVPRYPELMRVGGSATLALADLPPGDRPYAVPAGGVLLVHRGAPGDTPEYLAVQSQCPHAGCPLGYSPAQGLIECPCHGGRFLAAADPADPASYPGKVVHQPPRADLTVWKVEVSGDRVYVDLRTVESGTHLPPVVGGTVTLPLSQFTELAQPGGSLVGQPPGLADVLLVARTDANTVIALSAVCTHLACNVSYAPDTLNIVCGCHDSRFALDGAVTSGVAKRPLKSYPVTFDGQTVVVTI